MNQRFIPYQPEYSLTERSIRTTTILSAIFWGYQKLKQQKRGLPVHFAASLEVTDRCNAGCHYCYVYAKDWDQKKRMLGYLQLSPGEHRQQEQQIFGYLERLATEGIVHITLVGGEPTLAPNILQKAAQLFPIVWIVTNGAIKFPSLPKNVVFGVSLDGPPEYHNQSRDPNGNFKSHRYETPNREILTGMVAAIARNINNSERGAYIHLTLPPSNIPLFSETVDWLVRDVKKLRGIIVSGTTAESTTDPFAYTIEDRQKLKFLIEFQAQKYGWQLFPYNQPKVNEFLFNPENLILDPSTCSLAKRVKSLDFQGNSVGKCILRDSADCKTCMCNLTAVHRAISRNKLATGKRDWSTIKNVFLSFYG